MTVVFTVKTRGRSRFRGKGFDWMREQPADPNRMVDWKGLAEHVGVSLSTVKRMVEDGRLPKPTKLGLRKIGFRVTDIDAALEKMR